MELILLKKVENLGVKGDIVRVRDGYARNFLLPQNLALPSTRENQEFVAAQRARNEKRKVKEKQLALAKAEQMKQVKLKIESQAGEHGKLFGSVTAEDIRKALAEQGFSVERKKIHLKESIRSVGTYSVAVELFQDVKTNLSVEVAAAQS